MPPLVPAWSGTYRDITAGLVQRILRERAAGGADVLERLQSPLEILIPSRGVADTIVAAMSRAFPQGVAGIRLHTPETLALRILNAAGRYPRVAGARDRRLAMLLAAEEIRDARLNTPGIAVMLERSYRDIRDSGVTLQAFARRRDKFPEVSRASSLIDCWRRYEAVLSRCVAIDPADAFHQAIEVLPAADLAPQILFGFYDTTGIQEMFLQALHAAAGIDSIYIPVIPNDPRYSFADRQIRQLSRIFTETASAETRNALPRWSIHRYGTPSEEARETCREIRSLLDGGADLRRIGIVARALDPERIAALERAAADFDLALATPPTRPLSSHPFGRVLRLLLQIREQRFPRAAVVEIASAPIRRDFWGFSFHPERLDSASRRAEIAGGTSAWVRTILPRVETESRHDLEHVLNYIQVVDKLEKLTEPLATSRRGARWAETIETFAEAFHLSTDQDLAALEGLREIAEVCRRADASGTPFDANTIVHLLDTAPAVAPSPPRPLAPSVNQ